jgi:histone H3/H4
MSSHERYVDAVLQKSLARTLQQAGIGDAQHIAFDILLDVVKRYVNEIGQAAAEIAADGGRTLPHYRDVCEALRETARTTPEELLRWRRRTLDNDGDDGDESDKGSDRVRHDVDDVPSFATRPRSVPIGLRLSVATTLATTLAAPSEPTVAAPPTSDPPTPSAPLSLGVSAPDRAVAPWASETHIPAHLPAQPPTPTPVYAKRPRLSASQELEATHRERRQVEAALGNLRRAEKSASLSSASASSSSSSSSSSPRYAPASTPSLRSTLPRPRRTVFA